MGLDPLNAWFAKPRFAFQVGIWSVDPDARELVCGERRVRLEPLTMKLLLFLAGNSDRITSRAEILERLWDGRIATDDAVDRQLAKLRAALGGGRNGAGTIETLPKTGVRLTLPVVPLVAPAPTARRRVPAPYIILGVALILLVGLLILAVLPPRDRAETVDIRPLTFAPGEEIEPALSHDGALLAYAARPPGEARFALYLRALNGEETRRITPAGVGARAPAWSPSGERLAFFARSERGCAIVAGSVRTAHFAPVAPCGDSQVGLAWLGEDRLVAAERSRYGLPLALRVIALASRSAALVTHPPMDSVGDGFPLPAADGRTIYFVRNAAPGVARLAALDPASGAEREIRGEAAEIRGLAYGQGGRLLVSATRAGGLAGLWEVDPGSGAWTQVAPVEAGGLTASMDGTALIFEQSRLRGEIWRLGTGASSQITASTGFDRLPSLSPDLSQLAFVSNREGAPALWLREMASGRERRLPLPVEPDFLAWSPDGASLAVSGRDAGGMAIVILSPRTGGVLRLPLAGQVRYGSFSADGRQLYFARFAGGHFGLYARDLASGAERPILDNAWRPEALGRGVLLFLRPFESGLWRLDLASGAVRRLAPWPLPGDRLNWAATPAGIWVPDRAGRRFVLVDPESGALRAERPMPPLPWSSGLAVSRSDFLFSVPHDPETDLMLLRRGVGR